MGSREVSSDHTDLGNELDDNGPNTVNDATVTANANSPKWTTNFTDITIEPFTQDSGPCLPENLGVFVQQHYITSTYYSNQKYLVMKGTTHTIMPSSNKMKFGEQK